MNIKIIYHTSKGIQSEFTSRERKILRDKNANLLINLLQISLFLYEIQCTEKIFKNIKLFLKIN